MRSRVRIAVGGIRYETNSFAGRSVPADCFESHAVSRSDEVFARAERNDEIRGAPDAIVDDADVELVGLLESFGGCGAPVPDATYAALRAELLQRLADVGQVDAVYLPLHGAMTTTERDDAEADLLAGVREVVGADVPIVVSFDLHAAVSQTIADLADAVVGFKTCPHIDYVATGHRAIRLAVRSARREIRPVVLRVTVPMLTGSEAHDTSTGPLVPHMNRLQAQIGRDGLLGGSIFACQPWLGTPRSSWTITITHDAAAGEAADELAHGTRAALLADLDAFRIAKVDVQAVWQAVKSPRQEAEQPDRVVLVSDSSDSTSAGSPGDSVDCLRQLVGAGRPCLLASITDAPAAAAAHEAGVGATVKLRLGGRLTPGNDAVMEAETTVRALSDGRLVQEYSAVPVDLGRCALVRFDNADVLVTSRPGFMLDTSIFRHIGVDPAAYDVVQVKSAGGFRALWASVSTTAVVVDSLGASTSRLTDLPVTRLPQPLWPFVSEVELPVSTGEGAQP